MDAAHEWTDEEFERLKDRLEAEYNEASEGVRKRFEAMMESFGRNNAEWQAKVASGAVTEAEYRGWLERRATDHRIVMYTAESLANDAANADRKAMDLINNALPSVFAENANMAAFAIDKALGQDHSFDLYDEDTVRRLMMMGEDDQLIHEFIAVGPPVENLQTLRVNLDAAKDVKWNRQKFTSSITQSVLQGESIPDAAKRLSRVLDMDMNMAKCAARTAITGAENAGRVDSYKRAVAMGLKIEQEWLATLDKRTRHSHRAVDGQHIPVGEKFIVGNTELEYPADPKGDPSETYNCRCTLIAWFPDSDQRADRWSNLPDGMTYDEWKSGKSAGSRISNEPFDFSSYRQGRHIESSDVWLDSLPASMNNEATYDYHSGDYLTDAEKAIAHAAHFTGSDWSDYAYDSTLDEAIRGTSEHFRGPLFRGMSVDKDVLSEYVAGAKVKPRGIQSWSSDHEVALGFAKINYEPVMLVDITSEEKMAMSIQCISQASYEHEVLASMSIEYEVVRVYEREFEVWNKFREQYVKRTVTVVEVVEA